MLPDELEKRLDGIEDASKKGYPVRNLYKIACEPGLWLQAYVNIRANAGALTQGVSTDTIDGFSIERAEKLAKTLRSRELNRPGFPGECFICELRLPDHRFRWKHNKLFLLLPEEYGPAFPAIVDCYTSPPT